jgi:hypothetical protein
MGIATGRDSKAEFLLNNLSININLFRPSICYLELLVALENEIKRKENFIHSLDK